ncbi:MAG: hypothetical protein IPN27_02505 [Cellvibrionales bacterium]|jgi:hypothetical protein|nr:hypothetical protein [Cellvibrionales bacterium]MBK8675286.1 hypothetical protein [Cellvibrionales bacterium]HRF88065.1 hypothetical protein [Pseudomonadales bacterium]HRG50586.1 hypothetical protein [Pseudomonadales bacterium]
MKTYNRIVIIATCLMVGFCAGLIIWAQPLNGDLTRIGAHPERWYGWNAPQQKIPDLANTPRTTAKKHLLVLGDSFSEIGYWQAYLDDRYSFTLVPTRNTSFHKIIEKIRHEKPDGVVIESVERFTYAMFGSESEFMGNTTKRCDPLGSATAPITSTASASLVSYPQYARKTFPTNAKDISQGFYLLKQQSFFAIKPKKRQAKILQLSTPLLQSSQRSEQLLVIKSDLLFLPAFDDAAISTMQCSMRTLAHTLTDLQLPFVFLIVPDKTTAYQPYLTQTDLRSKPPVITRLLSALGIPHTIDMLPAVRDALAHNAVDFYLPNDTHWGYKGFQLAAQRIDATLQSQWPKDKEQQ